MSNPESFIEEVTEEVRRDRLYKALRRYGWIGVVAVVVLVGGASLNEWRNARARAAAEATGDAILAALDHGVAVERQTALAEIAVEGDAAALLGLIEAAEARDPKAAAARLAEIAADPATPALYRDLATLKRVMLPETGLGTEERRAALEPLAVPGAPFRVLAEEQLAFVEIELGETEAAATRLRALLNDNEATGALRQRASQLIVALGGAVPAGS